MCTLVLLRRRNSPWPMVIAANRDEMTGRPWLSPGRHWPDRPEVVAGLDQLGGGTWLGVNDHGVAAAILNRVGTLGPQPGKRTRGELVLEALDHADASEAADALAHLDGRAWRPFNMVVADNRDAVWIKSEGTGPVQVAIIPDGIHMLTAMDLDDASSPRVATFLPRFRLASPPDPGAGDWRAWRTLMADPGGAGDGEEAPAMAFLRPDGFGTVSSSLIALPSADSEATPVWLFAPGRPDAVPYDPVRWT